MSKKDRITVSNNNFVLEGVKWDGQSLEAVNNVAKALLNLTELFKSQNIHIESLLKIEDNKVKE